MSLADRLDARRGEPDPNPTILRESYLSTSATPEASPEPAPVTDKPSSNGATHTPPLAAASTAVADPPGGTSNLTPAPPTGRKDAVADIKAKIMTELMDRIGSRLNDSSMSEAQLHTLVRAELSKVVDELRLVLGPDERRRMIKDVEDDALGLGPIQRLLEDSSVTEIMVNRHDAVFIERDGNLTPTSFRFTDEDHLRRVIDRIVARVGRRVDESSPLVDARLQDGSRVNAVIPPLAVHGSSLTIRKFSETPLTVRDLIGFGSMTDSVARFLDGCVQAKLNILVSGGTGTGKTTLLNVLSSFIPADERIVTIEDAVELKLQQEHVVTLESRPRNIEGRGEITIRDLVRNSLRMRPDRIVVGECRGGEALDMLQAMNTGHDGSISTIHANSPRDCVARLETLVLMAGMELPLRAIREQVASAIDLIVQIERLRDGTRRVTQVTEVIGMEGDTVVLQDAFKFNHAAGFDDNGRSRGSLRASGLRPRFLQKFEDLGVPVDLTLFDPEV